MLKNITKLFIATVLIWWLIHNDRIDFTLFAEVINFPLVIAGVVAVQIFNACLTAIRWKTLLEIEIKESLPARKLIFINWIGLFFNSMLPGAVTGDLIKLFYIKHLNKKLTTGSLISSVLVDRFMGLLGLITILGIFSLVQFTKLSQISPKTNQIIVFNLVLFILLIIFVALFFGCQKYKSLITQKCNNIRYLKKISGPLLGQVWHYGQSPATMLKCFLMSLTTQGLNVFSFWLLASPFINQMSLLDSFSIIPIGMISLAIPISPGGLGVGHVAFDYLFRLFGETTGASIFNLFFTITFLVNLIGVVPYILHKKQIQKLTADHLQQS